MRRWLMPVRDLIHSSDVSTTLSRSAFLITPAGAAEPTPMGLDLRKERPGTGPVLAATPLGSTADARTTEALADRGTRAALSGVVQALEQGPGHPSVFSPTPIECPLHSSR